MAKKVSVFIALIAISAFLVGVIITVDKNFNNDPSEMVQKENHQC